MFPEKEDIAEQDEKVGTGAEDTADRGSPDVRDDKPVSVRDSLRSAIKEVDDKETDEDDEKEDKEPKASKKKEIKSGEEDDNDEPDAGDLDTNKKETKKEVKEVKAEVPDEKKEKAPASLPKEVTESWDKIPSNVQAYISKSIKDLTDTKSAMGRMQAHTRDMDTVLAQYKPSIDQLGVTPAQTVDRLFQWMTALAGPHKNVAIRQLANDFGIKLEQDDPTRTADENQQQQHAVIDPQTAQTLNALSSEVNALKSQQEQARARAAAGTVNSWAGLQPDGSFKNKPHYGKVRTAMVSLIQSGAVPMLIDDAGEQRIDLDGAYEAACYANAEVRAALDQEKQEAARKDAEDKAKVKKLADQAKLVAAKKAGSSIRPGAPAGNPNNNPAPKKGPNGTVSIRDSIRHSIREAAGN